MAEPENTTQEEDLGPRVEEAPSEPLQKSFLERMQSSIGARPASPVDLVAVRDPEIPPFKPETPFEKTRPFYGTPSERATGIRVDGGQPPSVVFSDPQRGAPAVVGEPEVTYEPFALFGLPSFGIDIPAEQKFNKLADIDYSKLSPILSINEVYDFSSPEQVAAINSYTGIVDRDGRKIPFSPNSSIDDKIRVADNFEAVSFFKAARDADDIVDKIPWETVIAKRLELPADFADRQGRVPLKIPGTDIGLPPTAHQKLLGFNYLTYTLPNYAEPDLRRAEALRHMNVALLELSETYPELKDARTRLGILDYTAAIKFYDGKKIIAEYGRTASRAGFEFAGWFVGEGAQAIMSVGKLFDFETPEGGLLDSKTRQETLTSFIPRYADGLQRRLLQNGVDVSFGVAEYLVRHSLSLPPRVVANAVEFIMPTSLAAKAKQTLSAADYKAFQMYRQAQAKTGRTDIDGFEFLNEFVENNKASLVTRGVNTLLMNKIVNVPLFGRGGKWARVGLLSRLNAGKNLAEMELPLPRREGYANILTVRDRATKLRDDILDRAAQEKRAPTKKEMDRIEIYEAKIKEANIDLMAEVAQQNVPDFMRTMARQNNFMVIGSAVGGQMIQHLGGDPGLGEAIGLGTSLVVYLGSSQAAIKWVKSTFRNADKKAIDQAEFIAQGINTFDPEYSEAILTRAGYMRELRDALIEEDIPAEVVNLSIGQLTGLAVLQALDATTRQNISAKQIGKFGKEVQDLIDIHAAETELVVELRAVFSRMAQDSYPEGSAASKMQELIGNAIDFAEKDIDQRVADFDVLISNASYKVQAMVENNTGKSLSHTGLGKRYLDDFETALTNLTELGIELSENTVKAVQEIAAERTGAVLSVAEARASAALSELGDITSGQAAAADFVGDKGVKPFGRAVNVTKDDIPRFETGEDLQSIVVETSHVRDRENASAGFRVLDREQYMIQTPGGEFMPVGTQPYVDGGSLLDGLISAVGIDTGVDLIDFATGKNLSPSTVAATTGTFRRAANNFFEMMADEGEDVAQTIKNTVELASADASFATQFGNLSSLKGNNDAIIAAMYQRHLASQSNSVVDTMKISMTQLRKFDSMFREMGFKAKSPAAQTRYSNVSDDITEMFGQFVVDTDDGPMSVGQLFVQLEDTEAPVAVATALAGFRKEWTDYKANWFDDPEVARWMGWGKRASTSPSADEPLGLIKEKVSQPKNWMNFNTMDSNNVQDMFQTWRKTVGSRRASRNNAKHIDPNSDVGKASIAAMRVQISSWVQSYTKSPDFSIEVLDEKLRLMQENFVGVDANGKDVPLFPEIGKLIDDTRGLESGSVSAAVLAEVRQAENSLVDTMAAEFKRNKNSYTKDMNTAIKTLQNFATGKVNPSDLIGTLLNGGPLLVKDFKEALKKTKKADGSFFVDDDIDVLLGDMAVQAIEDTMFTSTGRLDVNPRNANQLVPSYDFNVDMLADFIGYGNRDKEQAMIKVFGQARYNVAKRMVEFIRNKENSSLGGLSVSGIPRRFSVESYISRFYAINRDVIGPQYVATESILQRMRLRNFSVVQAALTDPKVGELFLEMLESGKPLPPKKEKELATLLTAVYVKLNATLPQYAREGGIAKEDLVGLPGWKVREMTEESLSGSVFPLHPEYELEMIRRIPTQRPMFTN